LHWRIYHDDGVDVMMTMERLRECAWEKTTSFTIPKDWPSGVYLGKLTRDENWGPQSYIVFIVKEDGGGDLLFQSAERPVRGLSARPLRSLQRRISALRT